MSPPVSADANSKDLTPSAFDDGCATLEAALRGDARRQIVAGLSRAGDMAGAMTRLAAAMRAHLWRTGTASLRLAPVVQEFDRRTRREGFHALHDWDGIADKVNDDIIPLDVLHFVAAARADRAGRDDDDLNPVVLAILIDYYFFHVLALFSLRIWDEGDADSHLDRLRELLALLQGPDGSGQRFADDPETLLLLATSHFELEERGYAALLDRVRTLGPQARLRIALSHASSIGSHLRFGFEATYGRDTTAMRRDNVADYPWLSFALQTLVEAHAARTITDPTEEAAIVEALLNGLSADPEAFVTAPWLRPHAAAHAAAFDAYRPSDLHYSPLSFFFNFAHNVVKGVVIDALLWGEARPVSFNALLTGLPHEAASSAAKMTLARTLMAHARSKPHRIRGRLTPVIVYDAHAGRLAYGATMRALRG